MPDDRAATTLKCGFIICIHIRVVFTTGMNSWLKSSRIKINKKIALFQKFKVSELSAGNR